MPLDARSRGIGSSPRSAKVLDRWICNLKSGRVTGLSPKPFLFCGGSRVVCGSLLRLVGDRWFECWDRH